MDILPNGNFLNHLGQEINPDGYNMGYSSYCQPLIQNNFTPFEPYHYEPPCQNYYPKLLDNGNILNHLGQEINPDGYNLGYSYRSLPQIENTFKPFPIEPILPTHLIEPIQPIYHYEPPAYNFEPIQPTYRFEPPIQLDFTLNRYKRDNNW